MHRSIQRRLIRRRLIQRVAPVFTALALGILLAAMPPAGAQTEHQKKLEKQDKGEKKKGDDARESTVVVEVKCDGKPVSGARVFLQQSSGSPRESSTNSRGVAQFSLVPQEETTILVTADGYKTFSGEKKIAVERVTVAVELVKEQ